MKSGHAKVLHAVGGEAMVAYPIRRSLELSADPIVVVVGHQADAVQASVQTMFSHKIRFQTQATQQGTGHAVMEGLKALRGYRGGVLILSGDVPLLKKNTLRRLVRQLKKHPLSLVTTVLEDPTGYGRVIRDPSGRFLRIVEHKDATDEEQEVREINAGIYAVDFALLKRALKTIRNDNTQGEYYLPDIIPYIIGRGHDVGSVIVDDPNEVRGANNRAQLAELEAVLRSEINTQWMLYGVTMVDPQNTYIGSQVKLGRDTVIEPGACIFGNSVIGPNCRIGAGAVITNTRMGKEVTIKPYSVIEEASVRKGAVIGPFARIRPGAEIMDDARVGNFVELKKTKLGKGAKAGHLAYLGDTEIGDDVNIGAGTITCNYDGYGKYRTTIGANAFVGSNTTLVAPLEVKKDAYVAAGSTITESVGPHDLAFGRARQINKKGRAKQIRKQARDAAQKAPK